MLATGVTTVLLHRLAVRHAISEAMRVDVLCGGNAPGSNHGGHRLHLPKASDLPPFKPDVALCNYYTAAGKMGLHQDKHESKAALKAGSPVVSFSIGDSANFAYCRRHPGKDNSKEHIVRLDSGDVLCVECCGRFSRRVLCPVSHAIDCACGRVFGGPSRMLFHGVAEVLSHTCPPQLGDFRGRLNITFRQSQMDSDAHK